MDNTISGLGVSKGTAEGRLSMVMTLPFKRETY